MWRRELGTRSFAGRLGEAAAGRMADGDVSDSEPTTRTLLRRVLDTADARTPRRPRAAQAGAQRALLETPSSRRLRSQAKMTTRRHSRGGRSTGMLTRAQASGHLEEQTPRTLLKNILLTAPESSVLMPESVVRPVAAPQVNRRSRRESSRGSLELQLPQLESPATTTLTPGLPAPGRRKQRLRLSEFQQGLPLPQEPPGNAEASSLTSSLDLIFATPLQPQSVTRPGLARRPLTHRAVDVGALLQDLRDNSLALIPPGDSLRTPVATQSMDTVMEDTQPFLQPVVDGIPSVRHSLPHLFHTVAEDAERSSGPGLQNHRVTEAEGSQGTVEDREPEGSSRDENTSGRPASPELASSTAELPQAKQQHQFLEPAPPLGSAILPSETLDPVLARLPPKPQTTRSRPRQDPYKAGLSHYVKLFSFYAKMPMEKKTVEIVEKCLDKYFQHLCNDLDIFAAHAGRKTVGLEDLELLMRRQGLVTDQVSLHVLVERHLPLEYRQLLIPCAFSGNSVFPAQK